MQAAPPVGAAAKSMTLGGASERVLDPSAVAEADVGVSSAGDAAVLWSSNDGTVKVATRAAGRTFSDPVVLPGAFVPAPGNFTIGGPVVGVGGGTVVTWHADGAAQSFGMLQVAVADPGGPVVVRAPLATLPAIGGSQRDQTRTAIARDGSATMAVARAGKVLVSQRAPNGDFGPEIPVSEPGEVVVDDQTVRLVADDVGGVTVTWMSQMPCVAAPAPICKVNRVATRPAGGTYGAPRSLAELTTGPSGLRGADPKRLSEPVGVVDGGGRTVLAWQRTDPGSFDAMEVSVGSATRGFSVRVALPDTGSSSPVPRARCTATTGNDATGTNYLFGALSTADGRAVVLLKRVSGCGSAVQAFTLSPTGTASAGHVVVAGIGSRAPHLIRRGARSALVVQSRNAIRAAFARNGRFDRLRGVSAATRYGPSALMRDGSLIVEYGGGCAGGTNSTIALIRRSVTAPVIRRVGGCGTAAPTVLDRTGALLTFRLSGTFEVSTSCPIPAAIAAQRAKRRAVCP